MKRLFVGCRVRVVKIVKAPQLLGQTGRITGGNAVVADGRRFDWKVEVDGHPPPYGDSWAFNSDQLEPVLPEGHAPSEFATFEDLMASFTKEHTQ